MAKFLKRKTNKHKFLYYYLNIILMNPKINISNLEGCWVSFYYILHSSSFYLFLGKILNIRKKISPLNTSIEIGTRISKEKIKIRLPYNFKYTIIKSE